MEDSSRLTEARRKEILENLRREREKRRDIITKSDYFESENHSTPDSPTKGQNTSLRSETLNKLLQERRETLDKGQDMLAWTKKQLQENIREEKEMRNYLEGSASECPTPRNKISSLISSPRSDVKPKNNITEKPKQKESFKKPIKREVSRPLSAPPRKSVDKAAIEAQNRYKKECTFKPKINPLPKSKDFNYNEPKTVPFESRLDDLSKPKSETIKKREQERILKEKEVEESYSFKPQISDYPSKRQSEPIEERLIKLGEERTKLKDKLVKEKEMNEMICHSFTPKISAESEKLVKNKPPIYKRIVEVQKQKNDEMEKLRLENEKKSDMAFQPRINPNSERLAAYKQRVDGEENPRKTKSIDKYRIEESEKYTFSPRITSNHSSIKNFQDFLERQDDFQIKLKEKAKQKQIK